jgi:hypothetical protein
VRFIHRAGVQGAHFVRDLVVRGQEEHGNLRAGRDRLQPSADLDAVHSGKPVVEQHQVWGLVTQLVEGPLARLRHQDAVPSTGQGVEQ